MKIIIGGAGTTGRTLAKELLGEGHEITLIDHNPIACEVASELDAKVIECDVIELEKIEDIDIGNTDIYIAVTSSDECNIISCALAKTYGCKTIAKIVNEKYITVPTTTKYSSIGVDIGICPELMVAVRIATLLKIPSLSDAEILARGKVQVLELTIDEDSPVRNKMIKEIHFPENTMIASIVRDNDTIIPQGNEILLQNDKVYAILSSTDAIHKLQILFGKKHISDEIPSEKVVIFGTTKGCIHLAKLLEGEVNVTLIDTYKKGCDYASKILSSKSRIEFIDKINKENFLNVDVTPDCTFVAAARREELNILSCLIAKSIGVRKTITICTDLPVAEIDFIDTVIDPKRTEISALLTYTRKAKVLSAKTIGDGKGLILEFKLKEGSPLTNKTIKSIKFPKNSIITTIVRNGDCIVPSGNTVMLVNDRIIIFALPSAVSQIERLF